MVDFEAFKPILNNFAKSLTDIDVNILTAGLPVIKKTLETTPDISPEILNNILALVKPVTLKSGEYFISQGENNCKIAFNIQGLFRAYCINDDGEEVTIAICTEGDVFASWEPILLNRSNNHYLQALEDSLIFSIDYPGLKELVNKDLNLARVYYTTTLSLLGKGMEMYRNVLNMKPQDRYIDLCQNQPELLSRASKQVIASYIGVTPVSFSRLKNRLAREQGLACM